MIMKSDGKFLHQDNGKPWLTDKDEKVPAKCPKCDSDMGLFLRGEPVFLCKDNKHYFGTVKFPDN